MRTQSNFHFSELVILKDSDWLIKQRRAGRAVAHALKTCATAIMQHEPNLSLKDLESMAVKQLNLLDCTPTFLGFKGFPAAVCISVNEQLVHGIPTDYILKDGDVVSIDLGATFDGVIADAARTYIYGTPKSQEHIRLIDTCRGSLKAGIKSIQVGKPLGVIGDAIHKFTKHSGFNLITEYGGHGIDLNSPHAEPFVANKANPSDGIKIQNGLSIAIEPMLVIGEARTRKLADGWTIATPGIGVHFENSICLMDNEVHIVTEFAHDQESWDEWKTKNSN